MASAEVSAHVWAEEAMEQRQEVADDADVDTLGQREQAGVASQFFAELVQGEQAALYLLHIGGVVLEVGHQYGVVDMGNADVLLSELFAEEHVLIAAVVKALVEGHAEHYLSLDEEVGGAEGVVGALLAVGGIVIGLLCLLVAVAQVGVQPTVMADAQAAVDHRRR